MIKSNLKYAAVFIAVLLLLVSCGKKPKQLNYIPKDVSAVLAIDAKKMALKSLELKDLLNVDIFSKNLPTSKDTIINKIKNSGIDFLNTAYIFGDAPKGDQKDYIGVVAALDDEAKFEKSLMDTDPGKTVEVKSDNDIKYAYVSGVIVGWKDKVALLVAISGSDKEALKAKLKELFAQPEENSLAASNEKFKALLKEEADMSLYLNYEKFGDLLKQKPEFSAMAPANLKETYLTATMNFENGKIVTGAKIYNNEENTKKAKEWYKTSVSKDLLKSQPGGDVIAFMSIALNTEPIVKYLAEQNMLEGVNQNLKAIGPDFDANYLAAALSGDIIATLNAINVKMEDRMDYFTGEMKPTKVMDYQYAVSIGLKDATKFQKLLDAVMANPRAEGMITKKDNYYAVNGGTFFVSKSNSLVIVSNEGFAKDVAADKVTPLNADNNDLISSNTMALGFDVSKVKPEILEMMGAETTKIVNASPIESVTISVEEVKSEVVTTKAILNFKNKEENSLISLQKALKEADKFMPAKQTPYQSDMVISDTTVAEDNVEVQELP